MTDIQARLRALPQVSALLEDARLAEWSAGRRRLWLTPVIQRVVARLRDDIRSGRSGGERGAVLDTAVARIQAEIERLTGPAWTRVINGTGVVVHTNLGRSCLPADAADAARTVAVHNSDLEFDLDAGTRGHRGRRVEEKAALLTGAEDSLVVNNNAAAFWLAVRFLAGGGPVLLSRGEVVAIGGSFRMHEILAETGCRLVEVGTTNRTSVDDYRRALTPGAVILKVHRSNFSVEGFTEEASLAELAELRREHDCRLIYDAGSGLLYPCTELGLPAGETELREDVATGCDLVTCSGDKLLGGIQAGIILGTRELVAGLRSHPMRRAFRVDKTTLAALDAVLSAYLVAEDRPPVPTLDLLAQPLETLSRRADTLLAALAPGAPAAWEGEVVPGQSSVGGGSFSTTTIESRLVRWRAPKEELEACHRHLRLQDPAVVGRMNQDGLALDVRTIGDDEFPLVAAAFQRAWREIRPGEGG